MLKSQQMGLPHISVKLVAYPHDASLCVISLLKVYLQKTRPFRGNERRLFLSYVLPHKAVGSETIARWIKATLKMTGVNTEIFHVHSTRAAACSAASRHGVSLDTILKTAGWTRCSTFATFYNKPIEDKSEFTEAVLGSINS